MPTAAAATKTRRQKLRKNPSWFLQQRQQQQKNARRESTPRSTLLETRDSGVSTECKNNNNTKCKKKKAVQDPHYMHAPVFTALISYHSNTPAAAGRRSVSFHGHHLHQCSNGQSPCTTELLPSRARSRRRRRAGLAGCQRRGPGQDGTMTGRDPLRGHRAFPCKIRHSPGPVLLYLLASFQYRTFFILSFQSTKEFPKCQGKKKNTNKGTKKTPFRKTRGQGLFFCGEFSPPGDTKKKGLANPTKGFFEN